jgi:hypothetical protein
MKASIPMQQILLLACYQEASTAGSGVRTDECRVKTVAETDAGLTSGLPG